MGQARKGRLIMSYTPPDPVHLSFLEGRLITEAVLSASPWSDYLDVLTLHIDDGTRITIKAVSADWGGSTKQEIKVTEPGYLKELGDD